MECDDSLLFEQLKHVIQARDLDLHIGYLSSLVVLSDPRAIIDLSYTCPVTKIPWE